MHMILLLIALSISWCLPSISMIASLATGNNMIAPVHLGWGAVSDLSLISDLSQKFKHDLWRAKSKLKLSQKQHLTPDVINNCGNSN